jgi:hypothetical protein
VVFPGATSDNYQSSTTMRWDNDPFGVNFVNFALGEIQPWDFLIWPPCGWCATHAEWSPPGISHPGRRPAQIRPGAAAPGRAR